MPALTEQFILDSFDLALQKRYIQVHYQPVVRTISRQVCSFEALARWDDPVHGMIHPDEFIGILEDHRLIHKLDTFVIREVCAQIRWTIDSGFYPIPISVNLSRRDFDLCDIFAAVDETAKEFRIPHNFLYIEITESMFADDEEMMHTVIDRFRSSGYQVWMDDFGSGYSSLNVLKDYTFDELKVDMRFLSSFHLRSRQILTSIIQMAKDIEIHTLVEGVETEDQFNFLHNIGCEKAQGYLFGQPLPYQAMIEHLRRIGVPIEYPKDRHYYDELGLINVLSAAPFMSSQQRNSLENARQLNSIPLALIEVREQQFRMLFYNTEFEKVAGSTHWGSSLFSEDIMGTPFPVSHIPKRGFDMLEEARVSGAAKLYFISGGDYYEFKAKCVAQERGVYCILLRLDNLSRSQEFSRTNTLDAELRHIYSVFDRITLLEPGDNRITPLYVGTHDEKVTTAETIRTTVDAYAEQWVFPDDKAAFLRFYDPETAEERIQRSGRSHINDFFRTLNRHGEYSWKQYFLVRIRPRALFSLIRDCDSDIRSMRRHLAPLKHADANDLFSGEVLWRSVTRSDMARFYWKDSQRRYLGVSKGFLDFFGFSSAEPIIGKTDEEIGWHLHSDRVKTMEQQILREGTPVHETPAKFLVNGVNRDVLFCSEPIHDPDGKIIGLVGCFRGHESGDEQQSPSIDIRRRDGLTGLLNARGIAEEAYIFRDMYHLRDHDFVRIHVAIEDFHSITAQYGYDHGDRVIAALGRAMSQYLGSSAMLGRSSDYHFVILRRYQKADEVTRLLADIKNIAAHLHEVDGIPCTLYLSTGMCVYSECLDTAQQEQLAEARLLADHNEHSSLGSRISHSNELFRMYDHLPLSFAVYELTVDPVTKELKVEFFYVNHRFALEQDKTPDEIIGSRMDEIFPDLEPEWYDIAQRAAFLSEQIVVDNIYFDCMKTHYYLTASQILRQGFCVFTYQPLDGPFATITGAAPEPTSEAPAGV